MIIYQGRILKQSENGVYDMLSTIPGKKGRFGVPRKLLAERRLLAKILVLISLD